MTGITSRCAAFGLVDHGSTVEGTASLTACMPGALGYRLH